MSSTIIKNHFGPWSFYKRALYIALPVMLQALIQNLVSLIDNFMVAGLGDIKMGGVNIAAQIFFLFLVFMNSLCISGGIFMSQFNGAKDSEGMRQVFRFKLLVVGIFAIAFSFMCFKAPRFLYGLMVKNNVDAEAILDQAQIYSRSVALSWIFVVVSQSISSSLREIEIVRPPLVISVTATLINTFFNWVLIYGNLGFARLEVKGAGYATVIARFCEMILFLVYAFYKRPAFLFNPIKIFVINISLFAKMFSKSLMILYSEIFWALSETFSNALYNSRGGAEVVSGMAAGFAVCNLIFISIGGLSTATSVIMGQELGANKIEECRNYKKWILSGAFVFGFFFMLIGFITVGLVPVVFGRLTVEARYIAKLLIIIGSIYLPLWVYLNGQYSISRAGGDTKMGMICDTVGNILFIAGMLLLTFLTPLGPIAMYAIVKLSDVPKSVIAYIWLKKEKWLVNLTIQEK